ncbi:MAG: hypothetical protein JJE39_02740 [Vicinamibacteria bacterium]|nr:hypothetical protein [Vicinamibacteria bacterium]
MITFAPTLLLALALLGQIGGANPAAPKSGLSRELSNSFGKKVELLEKFDHDPQVKRSAVEVLESELNSYVRFALAEKIPRGLREVRIVLMEGRLELRGLANLSEFSELKEKAGASFLSLFNGEMAVEVVADFKSDRGFGQFELVSAQVGPIPLSASIVGDIVTRATTDASRPGGFDIRAPFRLPYSAKRIRSQQARATIEY